MLELPWIFVDYYWTYLTHIIPNHTSFTIGECKIDCYDIESPAYSYGNIHGFKGKSSEGDNEMKFVTKWKVCGKRYTGTLFVQVKPSDMDDRKPSAKENKSTTKENVENSSDGKTALDEEPLMVVGHFDSGVNAQGVRSWSFKGYRRENA
jgi:hypothetical protein